MKRLITLMLILSASVATQARTCRVCGGLGHAFGHSEIICSACNGSGQEAPSAAEQMRENRDRENYANSANDLMEAYNLTPEEYFAYEELIKQAMEQVPVYQTCTACNGSGDCSMCGGYMNVSLDDDLCRVCGGSGVCISCGGAGRMTVGYQDNPNKDQLIQRAKEILNHGSQPQGQDTYGTSDPLSNPGDSPFGGPPSYHKRGAPVVVILLVVIGLGLLGWLGWRRWKKKKKS